MAEKNESETKIEEIEYLSANDIQKILHISKKKVWELLRTKEIPSIFFGNKYLVDKKDFLEWLKDLKEKTNSILDERQKEKRNSE